MSGKSSWVKFKLWAWNKFEGGYEGTINSMIEEWGKVYRHGPHAQQLSSYFTCMRKEAWLTHSGRCWSRGARQGVPTSIQRYRNDR